MEIRSVKYVATVTGEGITDEWDVYGTDLGIYGSKLFEIELG